MQDLDRPWPRNNQHWSTILLLSAPRAYSTAQTSRRWALQWRCRSSEQECSLSQADRMYPRCLTRILDRDPAASGFSVGFKMDEMTHEALGQPADPHAGHSMSGPQGNHDRHAGHSVAMFRDKFWLSLASHNSRHLLVDGRPTLAWIHSAFLPRLEIYSRHPWNGCLCLWRASVPPWGMERTCRPQARHDDPHQPGDHRLLWNVSRSNLRSLRD